MPDHVKVDRSKALKVSRSVPGDFGFGEKDETEAKAGEDLRIQAKLVVSRPDDPAEREADAMADNVMSSSPSNTAVMRCPCDHCSGDDTNVHMKSGGGGGMEPPDRDVENRIHSQQGGGEPMPAGERTFFESRFNRNFGGVRIHAGGAAQALSRRLSARAFTVGSDVFFGPGEYRPEATETRRLLAHELTHVVQQGGAGASRPVRRQIIQREYDEEDGYFHLYVNFRDTEIEYLLTLNDEVLEMMSDPQMETDVVEALEGILAPDGDPVFETVHFIAGHRIKNLIVQDLRATYETNVIAFERVAGLLEEREEFRHNQNLLGPFEAHLQDKGWDTSTIEWNVALYDVSELPYPNPVETATQQAEQELFYFVVDVMLNEAAARDPVVGAVAPDVNALWQELFDFADGLEFEAFELGTEYSISEIFLSHWLPLIQSIRFVPDGFDITAFMPKNRDAELEAERSRLLTDFMDLDATRLTVMFILDTWTESGLSQESFLQSLDLETLRDRLINHLTGKVMEQIVADPEYAHVLRLSAFEAARFDFIRLIYYMAFSQDFFISTLGDDLATTPLEDLDDDEMEVVDDPAGYYQRTLALAEITHGLLSNLGSTGSIEREIVQWAADTLGALDLPKGSAPLILALELGNYIGKIKKLFDDEREQIRTELRGLVDLSFDEVSEIIQTLYDFADEWIRTVFIPMLKEVALDFLEQNRQELQDALDNYDIENSAEIDRLLEAADEFEFMAESLDDGSFAEIEVDGQVIGPPDSDKLWDTAQFLETKRTRA